MAAAEDTPPPVPNNSADWRGPPASSPPVIRMRPSESITAAAFDRACARFEAGVHVPLATCGSVALRIPAKQRTAKRIQKLFGARLILAPISEWQCATALADTNATYPRHREPHGSRHDLIQKYAKGLA